MPDPIPTQRPSALDFGELWSIQESLLQAYRSLFITVESVLFALATFVLASQDVSIWAGGPIILLGLGLIPIWVGVCNARARAVTLIHWLIQRYERGEAIDQPYSRFREFQADAGVRREVEQDAEFRRLRKSKTRQRIDGVVPLLFGLMWLALAVLAFIRAV